jgi:cytochrome c oxidase subunit 4
MTDQHHVAHPTPVQYVRIAVILAVLTAIEVAMFYINQSIDLGFANAAILLVLAFLKFVIVIGWYMHLRFEKTTLSRFFATGFVMATVCYGIALAALGAIAVRN